MHFISTKLRKITVRLLLLASACTVLSACQSAPSIVADYREVPVNSAIAAVGGEQAELLEAMGAPQVVWARPFGLYEWVYCRDGMPDKRFVFDLDGRLLGRGWGGDEELCNRTAWAPIQAKQASLLVGD